jgi:uncharacterized BrkB/YihY/UPF0761 family membrane protein
MTPMTPSHPTPLDSPLSILKNLARLHLIWLLGALCCIPVAAMTYIAALHLVPDANVRANIPQNGATEYEIHTEDMLVLGACAALMLSLSAWWMVQHRVTPKRTPSTFYGAILCAIFWAGSWLVVGALCTHST